MLRVSRLRADPTAPVADLDAVAKTASSAAREQVVKGVLISLALTGIQIIYDIRCAKACKARTGKKKKR